MNKKIVTTVLPSELKNEKSDIIKGIENIISKYYWHFNTEETREAISNDVKFYLRTKMIGKAMSCKEVNIDANQGTITVTLLDK